MQVQGLANSLVCSTTSAEEEVRSTSPSDPPSPPSANLGLDRHRSCSRSCTLLRKSPAVARGASSRSSEWAGSGRYRPYACNVPCDPHVRETQDLPPRALYSVLYGVMSERETCSHGISGRRAKPWSLKGATRHRCRRGVVPTSGVCVCTLRTSVFVNAFRGSPRRHGNLLFINLSLTSCLARDGGRVGASAAQLPRQAVEAGRPFAGSAREAQQVRL